MALKVIGIGDNVCDKYYPAMIMYPGGQAMNFSVYAKMLGANSAYMGVFGRDAVADHIIRTLDELGVDHSRCRQYAVTKRTQIHLGRLLESPAAASMTGKTATPRSV